LKEADGLKIGIFAVQGDYEAHARMLDRLGVAYKLVRTPEDIANVDALILPGGESTTMLKFLQEEKLEQPLRDLYARGGAFLATCAGAILMAREVKRPAQPSLGFADIVVERNGYGRQLSSEVRSGPSKLKDADLEMVFIRAPIISEVGSNVEVLASDREHPVLLRQGRLLIATFHPELTDDTAVHELFLKIAAEASPQASSKNTTTPANAETAPDTSSSSAHQ
jgi:5'-phosphate synthase pdxT subunit